MIKMIDLTEELTHSLFALVIQLKCLNLRFIQDGFGFFEFSSDRPAITTVAACLIASRAVASPIPELPPIITKRQSLSDRFLSILLSLGFRLIRCHSWL